MKLRLPRPPPRLRLLRRLQRRLELPMVILAFVWLALFVAEAVWGVQPWLTQLGWAIWALFLLEFAVGFVLAPGKIDYLQRNWLSAIALMAPALRVFRIFRVVRLAGIARGTRFLRVISSTTRSMRALGKSIGRRGAPYVLAITVVVLLAGSTGMYLFENEVAGERPFDDYLDALWWTAMLMTSIGSEYWPVTAAGRVLCLLIALFSFSVFGYITAALASFFVGRDAGTDRDDESVDLQTLQAEIARLRAALEAGGHVERAAVPGAGPDRPG